jgi:hypothetical protein
MWIALSCALALLQDPDADGDGLSDLAEAHKYLSDPTRADSDGDGKPDGEWDERREFAYTVRSVIQVLPPAQALSEDYQDARELKRTMACVTLEVVHYPFNTWAETIGEDPEWRAGLAGMMDYLAPGPTTNWDEPMRTALLAELAAAGVDAGRASDRALALAVAELAFARATFEDGFTTFLVDFVRGKPRVAKGAQARFAEELRRLGREEEEQFERELLGRGMFERRVHGSCTSSAIYLATCLKAAGLPARTVLCVPAVDACDADEVELVRTKLGNHRLRRTLERSIVAVGHGWTSHTFNEVFVAGRWRRLNYQKLGQNILDPGSLGLMTHVLTFRDHAEAGLSTWGRRDGEARHDDVFRYANPYSCLELADAWGEHAAATNEWPAGEPQELTIERLYWADDPARPAAVTLEGEPAEHASRFFAHVREEYREQGLSYYSAFYVEASRRFVLRAAERPDVLARLDRGIWADPHNGVKEFDLWIEPEDLARMEPGLAYELVSLDPAPHARWCVAPGVTLVRSKP